MVYTSLLSLLQEEEKICREIQTRINILEGANQAEKDGHNMEPHSALLQRASEDIGMLLPQLHRLRGEIGGKLMMMEAVAADVVGRRLHQSREGEAER